MSELITINHVCSIGTVCHSSQICKDTGLKLESYPFDWIFSNITNIIKIIEDDFLSFLNRELYKSITSSKCGHIEYHDKMFNHHNPKDNEEHYKYFIRCVERFRKLLCSHSNKLFVLTFMNQSLKNIENIKKQVVELNNYISKKTINNFIFVICHIPYQDTYKTTILDNGNIRFILVYATSYSNGTRLTNKIENENLKKLLLDSYSFQIKKI